MKKICLILLAATVLVLGTPSCSDFLEEDNKAGMTADLTYSTTSGIQGASSLPPTALPAVGTAKKPDWAL